MVERLAEDASRDEHPTSPVGVFGVPVGEQLPAIDAYLSG